ASLPSGEKRMRPLKDIAARLSAEGITHVAVNWSEILRYRTTYKYTDYVTPARFQTLVEGDLLEPEQLSAEAFSELSQLPESWQQEVRHWGPELIQTSYGTEIVPRFAVYRVQ
ncbi:MAG: hypothetical protein KDA90_22410, partial [Planctomycetaceae bacterium]|nr:hypothetical protein [Planctomycetaceae bacterium]